MQSARELRSWLALAGLDTGDAPADLTPIEDMTPEQRSVLRSRLLETTVREMAAEEQAAGGEEEDAREGTPLPPERWVPIRRSPTESR